MKKIAIEIGMILMLIFQGVAFVQGQTAQKCDLDSPYDPVINPCGKRLSTIPESKTEQKEIDETKFGKDVGKDKKPELDKSDEGKLVRKKEEEAARQQSCKEKYGMSCESEDARQQYCKDNYKMSCEDYAQKREEDCKNAGYPEGCAQREEALKNTGGTGFKLNLDALTLTSNGQKSGKELFKNEEYTKKYGVVLGIILRVIDIMIYVIGSLAMITLIIAGLFMITNHGDDAWVSRGKTMMLYSLLGILAALLSFALVNLIQTALA